VLVEVIQRNCESCIHCRERTMGYWCSYYGFYVSLTKSGCENWIKRVGPMSIPKWKRRMLKRQKNRSSTPSMKKEES